MNNPRTTAVLLLAVLLSVITVEVRAGEDDSRCAGTATTCEQQIRKMLSKKRYLGVALENTDWGTVVRRVESESPAEGAGLREGDRIIGVDGYNTERKSPHEIKALLMPYDRKEQPVQLVVVRLGKLVRLDVRMAPMPKAQIDKIVETHLARRHAAEEE